MKKLFGKIKYLIVKKKCKKAILVFIFKQKMLCEKTEERVKKLVVLLNEMRTLENKYGKNITLERSELIFNAIEGLLAYLNGNEKGFILFEDLKTIDTLKKLI